jgi:cellulose synthase/poly-beta-1,6-N-acetylglucosamine synthase-like glycosyltransferase
VAPTELIFWASAALLVFTYLGYPAGVAVLARLSRRRSERRATAGPERALPHASVVLVARDEAARIDARIANLLELDYPRELVEIVVASDGSRDETVELARRRAREPVRVMAFPRARGKPSVLNDVVPGVRGSIVVFADARQLFEPGALEALVAPFADPRVGAVSGELLLDADTAGAPVGQGVGAYWRYEKLIRHAESRLDSAVGATGAIYAIRRELFEPLPPDTLLDDVLLPLYIARRGFRVLFEPRARAHDRVAATPSEEFNRKVRTLAGNFQLLARHPSWLAPFGHRLWFSILCHKGLRLLTPFALLAALASNIALAAHPGATGFAALLGAQAAFYAAAALATGLRRVGVRSPVLSIPYVVCLLSWATLVALGRFAAGRQSVAWRGAAAG